MIGRRRFLQAVLAVAVGPSAALRALAKPAALRLVMLPLEEPVARLLTVRFPLRSPVPVSLPWATVYFQAMKERPNVVGQKAWRPF